MRTHIILHTAGFRGDVSAAEIKRWHTSPDPKDSSKPWRDIGYHYVIRKDGLVEEGRKEDVNGAHCSAGRMNKVSIGICIVGHGDFEEWTKPQIHSVRELVVKLCIKYGIPADNIKGHNEYDSGKSCPGKLIDMNSVRAYFKTRLHETI
jgi:N-acetylmuramoyl-L-alanine amidase